MYVIMVTDGPALESGSEDTLRNKPHLRTSYWRLHLMYWRVSLKVIFFNFEIQL